MNPMRDRRISASMVPRTIPPAMAMTVSLRVKAIPVVKR